MGRRWKKAIKNKLILICYLSILCEVSLCLQYFQQSFIVLENVFTADFLTIHCRKSLNESTRLNFGPWQTWETTIYSHTVQHKLQETILFKSDADINSFRHNRAGIWMVHFFPMLRKSGFMEMNSVHKEFGFMANILSLQRTWINGKCTQFYKESGFMTRYSFYKEPEFMAVRKTNCSTRLVKLNNGVSSGLVQAVHVICIPGYI